MAPVPQAAFSAVVTLKFEGIAAAPVVDPPEGVGVGVGVGVGDGVGVGVGESGTVTGPELSVLVSVLQPESKVSRSDDASAARKRVI